MSGVAARQLGARCLQALEETGPAATDMGMSHLSTSPWADTEQPSSLSASVVKANFQ